MAPPHTPQDLKPKVDEVVILATPSLFFGIGQFYLDFAQVEDDEVIECLTTANAAFRKTG